MRIRTKDIKRIVTKYTIYTDNEEMEPVIAGLEIVFTKELKATKKIMEQLVDDVGQAFKDLFADEVE